jgi:hypothetical protein
LEVAMPAWVVLQRRVQGAIKQHRSAAPAGMLGMEAISFSSGSVCLVLRQR